MSDPKDDKQDGLADKLEDKLDEMKIKAAKAAARRTVEKVAHGVLDDLEEFLLGKKGAAEELADQPAVDPLDRIRQEYGAGDEDEVAGEDSGEPAESAQARQAR